MFNLVIDFNNLLMRSISTPGMTFYNSNFENEDDLNDIVKKLTIDICYNIRLFSPNKVIIVCDSPNAWRKDILPADERGYKANRIKDDTKNWDNLWKKMKKDGLRLPIDETFEAYYKRNMLIGNSMRKEVS